MAKGDGRKNGDSGRNRKPPPRWRRYLVQAELDLMPPSSRALEPGRGSTPADPDAKPEPLPAWQSRPAVIALGATCVALLVVTGVALHRASVARQQARVAEQRAETLTLRAYDSERALRIAPNPRSWSAGADATIDWPEPPQLLQLYLPVAYSSFETFALLVDKVDQGRVLVLERLARDSNGELRVSLNSSALGPGEYRLRLQGYTWRGERVDAGWIRLVVRAPRTD